MPAPALARLRRYGPPLLGVLLVVVVGVLLHRELRDIPTEEIFAYAARLPAWVIVLSLLLATISYAILTAYDALALLYLDHWLPYRRISLASFVGYVINHNLGPVFLGGSAVRYRLYSSWGLSSVEIAQVIAFTGLTFWLGFLSLAGIVLLAEPRALHGLVPLDPTATRVLACLGPLLVAAYLLRCGLRDRPLRVRGWEVSLPEPRLGVAQIAVSSLDWVFASSVLWVLLPDSATLTFPIFFGAFLLAQVLGVASTVPAGLGVFEATLLLALSPYAPKSELLGAVLVFRGVYYVLPLAAATVLLGGHELLQRRAEASRVGRAFARWVPETAPQAIALLTFVSGLLLLFGGATPTAPEKLEWLARFLPVAVLNLSNFLGSVVGMLLVLLARGLQLRLTAAWGLTVGLLTMGAACSLLHSLDLQTTAVQLAALAALVPCRGLFDRASSLLDEPMGPGWALAAFLVLLGAGWLVHFSYQHVDYRTELWWQFELTSQASRGLRGLAGASLVFLAYGFARLLRPAPTDPPPPTVATWDAIEHIVGDAPTARAHLAFLGDKSFVLSPGGRSFLMYGRSGASLVALGDPIGAPEDTRDLVWSFQELATRHACRTVFYDVGVANLSLYEEVGLNLLKLGHEARVPLADFALDGPGRARLRRARREVSAEGGRFEIVEPTQFDDIRPALEDVAHSWAAVRRADEKGFSAGRLDPAYLARFPVAVVRQGDQIRAFANLWESGGREEVAADVVRAASDAAPAIVDFLFVESMRWAHEQGYAWFNLGLAPLVGRHEHSLAPLWDRTGSSLYLHGEHFSDPRALRHYKDRFDPEWRPRYLASPGGFGLPKILAEIAHLVSSARSEETPQ